MWLEGCNLRKIPLQKCIDLGILLTLRTVGKFKLHHLAASHKFLCDPRKNKQVPNITRKPDIPSALYCVDKISFT